MCLIWEQEEERIYLELDEIIKFEDPSKGTEFLAIPDPAYRVTVNVDYNSPVLGTQHAGIYNINEYKSEIAKCITFVFLREL